MLGEIVGILDCGKKSQDVFFKLEADEVLTAGEAESFRSGGIR